VEIIERYCARAVRSRLVSQADQGQADAVNRALQYAAGEIHCFLNSDNLYHRRDAIARAGTLSVEN
jgi:glycosyltransferase involved in cell wall biosynthesis